MATVLILHSALGLRPAVLDFADRLRAAGHTVSAPDLFGGRIFSGGKAGYDEAVAFCDSHESEIGARADAAFAELSGPVVTCGFSMGTAHAQRLAVDHDSVIGAILVAGGGLYPQYAQAYPWADRWRAGVSILLERMADDPWGEPDALALLVQAAADVNAPVTEHVYAGNAHLFMDDGLPEEFDATAARDFEDSVRAYLSGIGGGGAT